MPREGGEAESKGGGGGRSCGWGEGPLFNICYVSLGFIKGWWVEHFEKGGGGELPLFIHEVEQCTALQPCSTRAMRISGLLVKRDHCTALWAVQHPSMTPTGFVSVVC